MAETGAVDRIIERFSSSAQTSLCQTLTTNQQRPLGYENVFLPFNLMAVIVIIRYTGILR